MLSRQWGCNAGQLSCNRAMLPFPQRATAVTLVCPVLCMVLRMFANQSKPCRGEADARHARPYEFSAVTRSNWQSFKCVTPSTDSINFGDHLVQPLALDGDGALHMPLAVLELLQPQRIAQLCRCDRPRLSRSAQQSMTSTWPRPELEVLIFLRQLI